ncbi:MAG: diaminopimelate decarboxylase [Candidatus Aenigmarchaeota archaeon]|nr:diaminopimelate decarboxylase [Candidatus Aenigmarchaeota archaeon]
MKGHLEVHDGKLLIGGEQAEKLAVRYGTPLYVYNGDRVIDNYKRVKALLDNHSDREVRVYYSAKANSSLAVMKILAISGAYADVVSPNEARLALDAGFKRERIMFTGTSVSEPDLREVAGLGVMINIDSFSQMRKLAKLGRFRVSIRWNPGEGAGGHEHTITAGRFVKFGIPEGKILEAFREARKLGLDPVGLHQHIGSGWLGKDVDTFLATVGRTLSIARKVTDVLGRELEFVDFGGGPGIPYRPDEAEFPLDRYAHGICRQVKDSGLRFKAIAVEPGRYIVGDAGILLTRINTVEEKGVPVIGVDSGFCSLLRPALYGAYHHMVVCNKADKRPDKEWLVAGNLCESGDVFNESKSSLRPLPTPQEGDILAILDAGAYGFSMSSRYNSRALPAEALVFKGRDMLIRKRECYGDLLRGQIV